MIPHEIQSLIPAPLMSRRSNTQLKSPSPPGLSSSPRSVSGSITPTAISNSQRPSSQSPSQRQPSTEELRGRARQSRIYNHQLSFQQRSSSNSSSSSTQTIKPYSRSATTRMCPPQEPRSLLSSNINPNTNREFDLTLTNRPAQTDTRNSSLATLESFPPLSPRLAPINPHLGRDTNSPHQQRSVTQRENRRKVQSPRHRRRENSNSMGRGRRGGRRGFGTFTDTIFFQHTGTYAFLPGERHLSDEEAGEVCEEDYGEDREGGERIGLCEKIGWWIMMSMLSLLVAVACVAFGAVIGLALKLLFPDWVDGLFGLD